MTDTKLKLIAPAAIIGLNRMPNTEYNTRAAIDIQRIVNERKEEILADVALVLSLRRRVRAMTLKNRL